MTDASLDGTETEIAPPPASRRGLLLVAVLCLLAGGAGFAPTFLGLWSPIALVRGLSQPSEAGAAQPAFIEVPAMTLSIPGLRPRRVRIALVLEVREGERATVTHLLPRVEDVVTGFLTGIAPEAYDRRGILEVIRAELTTRIGQALAPARIEGVLLTEFVFE